MPPLAELTPLEMILSISMSLAGVLLGLTTSLGIWIKWRRDSDIKKITTNTEEINRVWSLVSEQTAKTKNQDEKIQNHQDLIANLQAKLSKTEREREQLQHSYDLTQTHHQDCEKERREMRIRLKELELKINRHRG